MDFDLRPSFRSTSDKGKDEANVVLSGGPPLEDDVPPNFFDDFMNEDFIDGLNVVDTWYEEETKKANAQEKKTKERRDAARRSRSAKRKCLRSSSKEADRRDPSKTHRDILRDKDRCAKDQKAKLISERLRVVETGLVPPGMEMEVDFLQTPTPPVDNKFQKVRKSAERTRSPEFDRKYRRTTPEKIRRSPVRRNRTPARWIRSKSRSRSPRRRADTKNIEKRLEDGKSIEKRVKERSVNEKRDVDRREKRRRSSSRSPRRRRSKSPQSDISDREKWLRLRSRSRSPRKNKRFFPESDGKFSKPSNKKSFLKELKEVMSKPNEILPPRPSVVGSRPPVQNFMPTPVPPPQNFIPQTLLLPPQQEYDQQFFIGQPELSGAQNYPQPLPHPLGYIHQDVTPHVIPLQPMHMPYMVEAHIPQPVPMPDFIPLTPVVQPPKPSVPLMAKETLSKLFNDKKITLSDYLSLTGKFTDESRPVNIQNKIKVISDCQDVIKELSAEPRTSGRFTVRKTTRPPEKLSDAKHQSPFKKIPPIRFQYTTRIKPSEEKPTMACLLTKLLYKFGRESIFEEAPKPSPVESSSTQSPPPPPVIHEDEKTTVKTVTTIFSQTDRFKCSECELRSSKMTLHATTQTGDLLTFDIACQVGPDDFPKSAPKPILKNQSLAYLTPAQLLANARDESPPSAYPKHPLDLSPELKRPNRGAATNDMFNEEDTSQGRVVHSHDFDGFDRYRSESERVKGPLMFDRDKNVGSLGTRDRALENRLAGRPDSFNAAARPEGSFGYQGRLNTSWGGIEAPFNSRTDDENVQFGNTGRPAFNPSGQIANRGPEQRLKANPPGGMFGLNNRRF